MLRVSSCVADASAVLAALLREPGGDVAARLMGEDAVVSTVNLAEIVTRLQREGWPEDAIETVLSRATFDVEVFSETQAVDTGLLRAFTSHLGLSLGDRACLALARELRLPVLTADKAQASADVGVEITLVR